MDSKVERRVKEDGGSTIRAGPVWAPGPKQGLQVTLETRISRRYMPLGLIFSRTNIPDSNILMIFQEHVPH